MKTGTQESEKTWPLEGKAKEGGSARISGCPGRLAAELWQKIQTPRTEQEGEGRGKRRKEKILPVQATCREPSESPRGAWGPKAGHSRPCGEAVRRREVHTQQRGKGCPCAVADGGVGAWVEDKVGGCAAVAIGEVGRRRGRCAGGAGAERLAEERKDGCGGFCEWEDGLKTRRRRREGGGEKKQVWRSTGVREERWGKRGVGGLWRGLLGSVRMEFEANAAALDTCPGEKCLEKVRF